MPIQYRQTTDRRVIRAFIEPEKVWKWCVEEGEPVPDLDQIPVDARVHYVAAADGRVPIALFSFERRTSAKYVVHLAICPNQWARAVEAFKGALDWAWRNIEGLEHIAGEIPMDNKHAMRLANKAGFIVIGEEPVSYRRGGKLHGIRIVGLTREAA